MCDSLQGKIDHSHSGPSAHLVDGSNKPTTEANPVNVSWLLHYIVIHHFTYDAKNIIDIRNLFLWLVFVTVGMDLPYLSFPLAPHLISLIIMCLF